jgi:hypothetical protein
VKSQSPLLAALLGKRSEESSCPCVTERDNESGVAGNRHWARHSSSHAAR